MFKSIIILFLCALSLLLFTGWGAGLPQSVDLSHESQIKVPAAPQVQAGTIIVSDLDNTKYDPQAAYNSKHDEYLVVWERNDGDNPGIYGQRVTTQGDKIGPSPFSIAVGAKRRSYPVVDYDPINDRYLVVWAHDHDGSGSSNDISGRYIPWQGSDLSFSEFKISDMPDFQTLPKLVYNSTKKEFLILWLNFSSDVLKDIMGARLKADGSGFTMKDRNILGTIPNLLPSYDLEFNPGRNEYVVAWSKHSTITDSDIYLTRLRWDCQILGVKEDLLSSTIDVETEPALAAWRTADGYDGYQILWRTVKFPSTDKLEGIFLTGKLSLYAGSAWVYQSAQQEALPDVTSNFQRDQMLAVWSQESSVSPGNYGVWGRFISTNLRSGPAFEIEPPSGKSTPNMRIELIAVAGGKNQFLVVWEHERASGKWRDIYARLVKMPTVYLPLTIKK